MLCQLHHRSLELSLSKSAPEGTQGNEPHDVSISTKFCLRPLFPPTDSKQASLRENASFRIWRVGSNVKTLAGRDRGQLLEMALSIAAPLGAQGTTWPCSWPLCLRRGGEGQGRVWHCPSKLRHKIPEVWPCLERGAPLPPPPRPWSGRRRPGRAFPRGSRRSYKKRSGRTAAAPAARKQRCLENVKTKHSKAMPFNSAS